MKKVDLNAPAFGENAQKLADVQEGAPAEPLVEEPVEKIEKVEEPLENLDEPIENKVRYTRFQNVRNRALEAEKEAAFWRAKAEERNDASRNANVPLSEEMTPEWKALYGDSQESKYAYQLELKRQEAIYARAEERAIEAVQRERVESQQHFEQNLTAIDESLEDLEEYVGRPLTQTEQEAVIDIVDEWSPKGEDGKYVALIPYEKAWDYYELSHKDSVTATRTSRNAVAARSGASTHGEPSSKAEDDKNFNPSWGGFRNPLTK